VARLVERFGPSAHRRQQLSRLEAALLLLRNAGCARVFVGGSFVTARSEPNDINVAWDIDGVDADALDPVFFDFEDERAAQKQRLVENSFPHGSLKGSQADRLCSSSSTRETMSRSVSSS